MNIKDRLIQLCDFYKASDVVINNIKSHNFSNENTIPMFLSNEKCDNCCILAEDIRKQVMKYFYNMSGEVISCNEKMIKNLLE